MTEKEMIIRLNEVLEQVFADRKASTYSELMTAAYDLWAFLRYDANCEHAALVPPTEGYFEF